MFRPTHSGKERQKNYSAVDNIFLLISNGKKSYKQFWSDLVLVIWKRS